MKYLILFSLLCSCAPKKGALENITDEVLKRKEGVEIDITPKKT